MARSTFKGPVKSVNGFEIGSTGTALTLVLKSTATVDLPDTGAGLAGTLNVTITGAVEGDLVFVAPRTLTAGLVVGQAFVSAADTVTIRFINGSAGSINQASATWDFVLIRS